MGRTLRAKRGIVTNMVGAELFRRKILAYEFDKASSMYATMPEWTPSGYSLEMSVQAHPLTVDGTQQDIMTNGTMGFAIRAPDNVIVFRYNDTTGVPIVIEGPVAVAGVTLNLKATADPSGVTLKVNDTDYISAQVLGINQGNGFNTLAAGPGGGAYFDGPMRRAIMQDNSPIQATTALMGGGSRYIQFPEFSAGESEDFEISFDWVRVDRTGSSTNRVIGEVSGTNRIDISDSGSVIADRVLMAVGGGDYRWDGGVSGIEQGQSARIRIRRVGGIAALYVDEVSRGTDSGPTDAASFSTIYQGNGSFYIPVGSAMQNVSFKSLASGDGVIYKIDEGSGTTAKARDQSGALDPAKDGVITPDADWQYIASRSRSYPMNEGDGNTFADTVGGNDATIQNYNPDNWKTYPE